MQYRFKAIEANTGKKKSGIINVASREIAIQELKGQQLYITELEEDQPKPWKKSMNIWIGKQVQHQEFIVFFRQFATLLYAGSTVSDSLRLLVGQAKSRPFKQALLHICKDVESGKSLSEAFQKYPRIFNPIYVNMVRAGEVSGQLDEVMDRLATFMEKEHLIREKVKSALIYPIIVSLVAFCVIIFLLTYVIPRFIQTIVSTGGELPLPTVFVLGVSSFILSYWPFLLSGMVLVGFLSWYIYRLPKGRYYIDYIKLKLPIFGPFAQKAGIARMARTFSSLYTSAVPILQCLTMIAEIMNNRVMANVLLEARASLQAGDTLAKPLAQSWAYPPLVTHMISIGEKSGHLEEMLDKIADFYEEEVAQTSSRLSTLVEPIIIVILSLIVGIIVLAAMLPMFEIYRNV